MSRPQAATNILSRRVKIHIGQIVEDNIEDLANEIKELKGKQKIDAILVLLSYIIPKQKPSENDIEDQTWFETNDITTLNMDLYK